MHDLIRRWQAPWGLIRGLPPAERTADALRVRLGLPGREYEVLAYDEGDRVRRLAAEVATAPDPTWLTVFTDRPDQAEIAMKEGGLPPAPYRERFMSIALADQPSATAPAPYEVVIVENGPVIRAEVQLAGGEIAAYGHAAVVDTDVSVHDVRTLDAHQRRGLGRAVMSALAERALAQGGKTAYLTASAEGERLYLTLGWTNLLTMVVGKSEGESVPAPSETVG
jgi:GNAT superfamily N-acetyltransferase